MKKGHLVIISMAVILIINSFVMPTMSIDSNENVIDAPGPPSGYWGQAYLDGELLTGGLNVSAWIDGVIYDSDTIVDGYYSLDLNGDDTSTTYVKEGGVADDLILFQLDDGGNISYSNETRLFVLFGDEQLDLHFTTSIVPVQLKINEICTDDAGSQYVYLYNPSSSPVPLSDYLLQKDVSGSGNQYEGAIEYLGGTIGAGGTYYVDLNSTGFLNTAADDVKLVWNNSSPGTANGNNVMVDRVEYGNSDMIPDNTTLIDANAPSSGWSIRRTPNGQDTDNCLNDFQLVELHPVMPPVYFEKPLSAGWNLISIPLEQSNESIQNVLSSIDGDWDTLYCYNSTDSEHWKSTSIYKPESLNEIDYLNHKMGLWIHMINATMLNVSGQDTSTSIQLHAGWNLVGYPSMAPRLASDALTGTGSDTISIFNASYPYMIEDMTDLTSVTMLPGEGYWIHVPSDSVWTVDW